MWFKRSETRYDRHLQLMREQARQLQSNQDALKQKRPLVDREFAVSKKDISNMRKITAIILAMSSIMWLGPVMWLFPQTEWHGTFYNNHKVEVTGESLRAATRDGRAFIISGDGFFYKVLADSAGMKEEYSALLKHQNIKHDVTALDTVAAKDTEPITAVQLKRDEDFPKNPVQAFKNFERNTLLQLGALTAFMLSFLVFTRQYASLIARCVNALFRRIDEKDRHSSMTQPTNQ